MISKVYTSIPFGFEGKIIEVEGAATKGLTQFDIVGMANKTISEARQRVRNAITSSKLLFPTQHLTINLAPAELQKDGNFFDLPIAISILILSGQLLETDVKDSIFVGELSLDGKVRPVRGIISILETGKSHGFKRFFIPADNLQEASLLKGLDIIGINSLTELLLILKNQQKPTKSTLNVVKNNKTDSNNELYLEQIRGQTFAKKALIVALAGHHNLLLSGPPGAGKTMLAKAAKFLLPDPSYEETLEIAKIYSLVNEQIVLGTRPFRAPHHTSSLLSLIGGGASIKPGEISLAHHGILFLDELPEYPRANLEALRQPLEDRSISITRANAHYTFPSDFILLATMNPCPCGFLGDPVKKCTCKDFEIKRYKNKLSGPLLDRIDIRINVERTKTNELLTTSIPSANIKKSQNVVKNNITEAINHQHLRYGSNTTYNANISSSQIVKYIHLTETAKRLLDTAAEKLNLSARSYFKVIKVARTIADLNKTDLVEESDIAETLSFRFEL